GEEHAAEAPEQRRAQLGVEDEQLRAAERSAGEFIGRQLVLRVPAHALRPAGVEEEVEDGQRRPPSERQQPAPAYVAGQDDRTQWLVVGSTDERTQVIEIRTERPLPPLRAHRSEPAAFRIEEAVTAIDDDGAVERRQGSLECQRRIQGLGRHPRVAPVAAEAPRVLDRTAQAPALLDRYFDLVIAH